MSFDAYAALPASSPDRIGRRAARLACDGCARSDFCKSRYRLSLRARTHVRGPAVNLDRVNLDANQVSIRKVCDAGLLAGAVTVVWQRGEVLQINEIGYERYLSQQIKDGEK